MANKYRYPVIVIDGVESKECSVCHRILPLAESFYFLRSAGRYQAMCKHCNGTSIGRYKRNREEARQQRKEMEAERLEKERRKSAERLRKIDEALAKVAAMKEAKRRMEAEKEAEKEAMRHNDPMPVKPRPKLQPTDEPCRYCKSYSSCSGRIKEGFCLRHHKEMRADDTCGYWRPDVTLQFKS